MHDLASLAIYQAVQILMGQQKQVRSLARAEGAMQGSMC